MTYAWIDSDGVERMRGEISPAPGGGSLPEEWTVDETPGADADAVILKWDVSQAVQDWLDNIANDGYVFACFDHTGNLLWALDGWGGATFAGTVNAATVSATTALSGSDLSLNGGDAATNGGDVVTGGGDIVTNGGDMTLNGGTIGDEATPPTLIKTQQLNAGDGDLQVTGDGFINLNVPTADPHLLGMLWNDGGAVKISAG